MRILIMTGPLYLHSENNASLIGELISYLKKEHEVHILTPFSSGQTIFEKRLFGAPVHWTGGRRSILRKLLDSAVSKVVDRHGYSGYIQIQIMSDALKSLREEYVYEAVIATTELFSSAMAAVGLERIGKIVYIMDPPEVIYNGAGTSFRKKSLPDLRNNNIIILTTPFIKKVLADYGYSSAEEKIVSVDFPMIQNHAFASMRDDDKRIRLLFCGWLYSKIRSPKYLLDIISHLDECFSVTFMGKECEKLKEPFSVKTKAEVIALPNQPYEAVLHVMQDADIMINIGNSVPVHMPSKTLEYINTDKPFINLYKMDDCLMPYYSRRYPLCINLSEKDNIEEAAERFKEFCLNNKGKNVDRVWIEAVYEDCTLRYIA